MSNIEDQKIKWRTDALKDAQHTKGDLHAEIWELHEKIRKLMSLACAAKQLCEFTRSHEYPKPMSSEFMELTSMVDELDTEVRRVFPKL